MLGYSGGAGEYRSTLIQRWEQIITRPSASIAPATQPTSSWSTQRLSNGLVLVKWWLLAIPHLIVVGVLTGTATYGVSTIIWGWDAPGVRISLLGILVLIAAIILLFTGRYHRPLFDLIMGINRWAYRVATYVALMRDEYPPFRLDQGSREPEVELPRMDLL